MITTMFNPAKYKRRTEKNNSTAKIDRKIWDAYRTYIMIDAKVRQWCCLFRREGRTNIRDGERSVDHRWQRMIRAEKFTNYYFFFELRSDTIICDVS